MNRLEQIRERNERRKELMHERKDKFDMLKEMEYHRLEDKSVSDIEYLLSKLETAEKALGMALQGDGVTRQYEESAEDYTQLYNAVNEVLKQIRE